MLRTLALVLLATTVACGSGGGGGSANKATPTSIRSGVPAFVLTSPAFAAGAEIPRQYTCDGRGQSPPLSWTGAPSDVASFALRVQDVDTPQKFIHWILYDIPASTTSLADGQVPAGARQTKNSFGNEGYGGPCPPAGSRHHYVFTLLALGTTLSVSEPVSPNDLWSTLERSAVRGETVLAGTYQRGGS